MRVTTPSAGDRPPEIKRSRVLLPASLRPTTPVRSGPNVRLRLSKSVTPAGVLAETLSRVASADGDALRLGLVGMENHEQHGGQGGTGCQCDDHDLRASCSKLVRDKRMGRICAMCKSASPLKRTRPREPSLPGWTVGPVAICSPDR